MGGGPTLIRLREPRLEAGGGDGPLRPHVATETSLRTMVGDVEARHGHTQKRLQATLEATYRSVANVRLADTDEPKARYCSTIGHSMGSLLQREMSLNEGVDSSEK